MNEPIYTRKYNAIDACFYEVEDKILRDASRNFYHSNKNDYVWVSGIFSNPSLNRGCYQILLKSTWLDKYLASGGKIEDLQILLSHELFRIVGASHIMRGKAIAEEIFGSILDNFDVMQVTKFEVDNDGLKASSKEMGWKPWGSEFSCPLRSF